MLLFWSLDFSLNLKQEVRSVLLNFCPVSTLYFFPYFSIVEAGSQAKPRYAYLHNLRHKPRDDFTGRVDQIEEDLHIAWLPLLEE